MIPANPGNLLPFYPVGYSGNDLRWQRHRLPGQDVVPYGLPCPRTRLLPFQMTLEVASITVTAFALFNPEDDSEVVNLDTALLEVETDGARSWVTWKADTNLDVTPDCGYWYVFLNFGANGQFVSEVLDCRDFCGFETIGLQVQADSCAVEDPVIQFVLEAAIEAGIGTTYVIQRKTGMTWDTIATNDDVTVQETLANETREYRIVATTVCGLAITQSYVATWDSADGCATLDLGTATTSTNEAGILSTGPVWRLKFDNATDKANVLYQTGYEQYLYLPTVIWDVPEIERETDIKVNGEGTEIKRFTRTVERRGFETPDVPDYVIGFLTKAGDLATVTFEDAKLADALVQVSFEVENLTFVSPERQGPALNIGRFYFDVEAEAFQGCQENFVLE